MSDNDSTRLHDLLIRATAPADEHLAEMDPEAASLRRGWLELCNLIQADQTAEITIERNNVAPIRQARDRRRNALSPWLVAAVAATVLIAAGVTAFIRSFGGGNDIRPQPQQIAQTDTARGGNSPKSMSGPLNPPDRQRAAADRWQWGDSVDDDITAVAQATLLAQQDWYAQSTRIEAVGSGLYELENEIEQGKP